MPLIGLNGFGRIGKCIFLQLLNNDSLHIFAINAPDLNIDNIESYLKNDSVHLYKKYFKINILDNDSFEINGHKIHLFRERNAENIDWKRFNIELVIDASGVYLTKEKAEKHNVNKVIISAPAKDDTPLFVYGANDNEYKGQSIISNASCTTNSICPVLRCLHEHFQVKEANFTTIHASTSSQQVVDTSSSKSRTNRSIFNNIIPHTTGASSSIGKVLPDLLGKVVGTSVRVPVNNVSLIDVNVELSPSVDKEPLSLESILKKMENDEYIQISKESLVSSDFMTSTCPSIIDQTACMTLAENKFKLMIWYDNEWSYSHQLIKMAEIMLNYSNTNNSFIEKTDFHEKDVLLRLDLNLPMKSGIPSSTYRLDSALPTLNKILSDNPQRLIIMSHFGRPTKKNQDFSIEFLIPLLKERLQEEIGFLKHGLSHETLEELKNKKHRVYLLENLRFHSEETEYMKKDDSISFSDPYNVLQQLGSVYVNDAFGCLHRNHLSICGVKNMTNVYGYLVDKELRALQLITQNPYKKKTLAIIGGAKMDDKLKLLKNLSKKVDSIYICGGNINSISKNNFDDYFKEIISHKAKIFIMKDGLCGLDLDCDPVYKEVKDLKEKEFFFDIGMTSLQDLQSLICDHEIIFWNGTLGVVEQENFKHGSEFLVHILQQELQRHKYKKVIIGGGDTGGFVNNYDHSFTHISTGGGAAIEYITFNELPGLKQFSM